MIVCVKPLFMYQKGTPLGNFIHQKAPFSGRKPRYEKKVQKLCPKRASKTIYIGAVLLLPCCGLQARAAERIDSHADHPPGGRFSQTGFRRNRSLSAPSRSDDFWNQSVWTLAWLHMNRFHPSETTLPTKPQRAAARCCRCG